MIDSEAIIDMHGGQHDPGSKDQDRDEANKG
jgi:hypothetical protein